VNEEGSMKVRRCCKTKIKRIIIKRKFKLGCIYCNSRLYLIFL